MCKGQNVFVARRGREGGAPRSLTGLTCRLGDARWGDVLAGQRCTVALHSEIRQTALKFLHGDCWV